MRCETWVDVGPAVRGSLHNRAPWVLIFCMERRTLPRLRRRLNVRYSKDGKEFIAAFTRDVGPGGMFVVSRHVESVGARLQVRIEIPDVGTVDLQGEVCWCKRVPINLQSVQPGGFGFKVTYAPEAWYAFFSSRS